VQINPTKCLKDLLLAESLKDTIARFIPFWHTVIASSVRQGKQIVIAAHGNNLRAWLNTFGSLSDRLFNGKNRKIVHPGWIENPVIGRRILFNLFFNALELLRFQTV